MENSFLYSSAEALDHFNVSEHKGLSQDAVLKFRQKYGPNGQHTLTSEKIDGPWN